MSGPLPVTGDAIVCLAGESVAKGRWSAAKKERIRESRVVGTRNVVAGIAAAETKPEVFVSASAVGIYGDTKHNIVHEDGAHATDFLAEVCEAWEAEARAARDLGVRTPIVRIGVVLGKGDGAYPLMTRPLRMGIGGTIDLGKAWMSWIHLDDLVGILVKCIDDPKADRVYNGTAPNPCSNYEFTKTFGKIKHRPTLLPVPSFALRLLLGEFAQIVTASQRIRPLRTLGLGYEYQFPTIREAVLDLEGK
jgi:uncharacterized protein (TIGR01777 family)